MKHKKATYGWPFCLPDQMTHISSLNPKAGTTVPYEPSWARAVYHVYIIRTQRRDELQRYLSDTGVATGLHYPMPLHFQNAYESLGYKGGDFPVSEKAALEILSLPMYPELTLQQEAVVDKIKEFLST